MQALACLSRGGERTVRNDSICMKIYSQIIYKPPILMYPRTFGRGNDCLGNRFWFSLGDGFLLLYFPPLPSIFRAVLSSSATRETAPAPEGRGRASKVSHTASPQSSGAWRLWHEARGGALYRGSLQTPPMVWNGRRCSKKTVYIFFMFFKLIYSFYFIFHRHVHGGGCGGGYWLRDVSVETVHPHGPGLGKNLATLEGPDQKHEDIDTIVLI